MGTYKLTEWWLEDEDGNVQRGKGGELHMPESWDIAFKVFDRVVREDLRAKGLLNAEPTESPDRLPDRR